jgi:hydrogenase nickel incorporation protein HypA/HybF
MHEFSVIKNIIDIIDDTIKEKGIAKVTRVKLLIGKMRQIVPEVMQFAFEEETKGTLIENAQLVMEFKSIIMKCNRCSDKFEVLDNLYFCEKCQCADLSIVQGQELIIESIEGDE